MHSLDQALAAVVSQVEAPLPAETVALGDALGRRLAADVHASTDWPVTDRSAMDGFGVVAGAAGLTAGTTLLVVGESLAGHPYEGAVGAGEAIRIMTGAVVPQGIDAVVPVEQTSGYAHDPVRLDMDVRAGDHIRRRGSELAVGARVVSAGARLRSAEIGVLAALGHGQVTVHRRPVVAILATGDEVVPIEREPAPHQVRDSNAHALAAQVRESSAIPLRLGIAGDDRASLLAALRRGLQEADVLVTIGGVSKGTHDLVHACLRELGVTEVLWGIALKPGKPTWLGVHGTGTPRRLVFGLPGNPASCFTVFDLLVRPALARLQGADDATAAPAVRVRRAGAPFRGNRRLQAIPARLQWEAGAVAAALQPSSASGDPFALVAGDGHALVPEDARPDGTPEVLLRPFGGGLLVP